jgi:hypothetical protein
MFSKVPFFRWTNALCVREKCCSDRIFPKAFDECQHFRNISGKIFLTDALYDRIYFFPSPRAVAREGIGGRGGVNPSTFLKINIFGKSGWPFGKLRQ